MNVMGFHLGLSPPLEDSSHVPTRQVAVDVLQMRSRLTDEDVYIGPGHFSHRWSLTQWQNPFRAGEGRTALESVLHYARWIADQDQCNIRGIWVLIHAKIHANWVADLLLPPTLPPHV